MIVYCREGAIDRLVKLYKKAVYKTGVSFTSDMSFCRYTNEVLILSSCAQGYLTENGVVDLARVQLVLTELGEMEDAIFKQRREDEVSYTRHTTRFTLVLPLATQVRL